MTPEMMTTDSHNSREDVTLLTDEQALWAACVHVSESRFIYPWKDHLLWTISEEYWSLVSYFASFCVY